MASRLWRFIDIEFTNNKQIKSRRNFQNIQFLYKRNKRIRKKILNQLIRKTIIANKAKSMEIIKNSLFLTFIISAVLKAVLHIRLINTKQNISYFKKYFIIGFSCQPFFPIFCEDDVKKRNTINYLVLAVYTSLALMLIIEFAKR